MQGCDDIKRVVKENNKTFDGGITKLEMLNI